MLRDDGENDAACFFLSLSNHEINMNKTEERGKKWRQLLITSAKVWNNTERRQIKSLIPELGWQFGPLTVKYSVNVALIRSTIH